MGDMPNFPDDSRLRGLPDQIRSRFRGRSVPSQGVATAAEPKPVTEFLVAKTIIPINLSLKAGIGQEIFIAATDWVVQAISLKGMTPAIKVVSSDDVIDTARVIPLDAKKPVTVLEGLAEINIIFKAGETVSLVSSVDVVLLGSMELVQESGKITRTEDPV